VSSQFDADRLDYMRRDRLMTGTQLDAIDFEWLVANLEVGSVAHGVDEKSVGTIETFVLGPKAIYAAETYVLGLFQLYPTVYFHKATRGAEKIFGELLYRLICLTKDGSSAETGLPANHPLIQFARNPEAIGNILALDDTVVWGSLSQMAEAPNTLVSSFARRLRDRQLYKCMDVRERLGHRTDEEALERACASIHEKLNEWMSNKEGASHRILIDQAVREPYRDFQESKGPLNQIMIRTTGGTLVDLGERSRSVKAIEPFRLFRVYCADDDQEAQEFVKSTIKGEGRDGAA
jgi:HD superfamily phosphohydrolase